MATESFLELSGRFKGVAKWNKEKMYRNRFSITVLKIFCTQYDSSDEFDIVAQQPKHSSLSNLLSTPCKLSISYITYRYVKATKENTKSLKIGVE